MTAMQLDLFRAPEPALPIAAIHPLNRAAFDLADTSRERHAVSRFVFFEIKVVRAKDGWRATCDCQMSDCGWGGPVFRSYPSFPTYAEARRVAVRDLVRKMDARTRTNSADRKLCAIAEGLPL